MSTAMTAGQHSGTGNGAHPSEDAAQGMPCPDPSAHNTKNSALQNQASAAALYSTNPTHTHTHATDTRTVNPLGPDGKLSSASAATSLKYAKTTDLPAYPIVGIDTRSSANTAALLASQNTKSPEWWKPEHSNAAGKAALLANDYKMAPLWHPEASAAGSKAALLAHRDGGKLNLWQPEASADGHSAATIAMRTKGLGPGDVDYGYTDNGRKNAFTAATGAAASSKHKRAQSIPPSMPLYPDAKNSAKNALGAATLAHSASMRASPQTTQVTDSKRSGYGAMEAARIQHAKSISRDMYTSTPPVALETEEKRHNDALRASAISMAKKIYDVQQNNAEAASAARTGANAAHSQRPATGEEDIKQQAMRYIGIQEAAQKLAQERLAKIGYDENAAYRSYYGYEKPRSKLSMRRGRNRASSASEVAPPNESDSDDDDFRSRRIRSQMQQLNKNIADVDAKKRDTDRKSLMAAAERKVQAQMAGMDKKIYDETGKMSSSMVDDWDQKARQKALANSEVRMENHGRVHIGNGKWMDQSEIDAIALARIQPTLDEINQKTDKRRAEDERRIAAEESRRLDAEERKRQDRVEKERAAEIKAEEKQAREEEKRATKLRGAEGKASAKQEKEAVKAKQVEEDRMVHDEVPNSTEVPAAAPVVAGPNEAAPANDDLYRDPTPATQTKHTPAPESDSTSPTSPSSGKGLKSIFSKLKRRSKHTSAGTINTSDMGKNREEPGFVGGAALRSSTSQSQSHPSTTGVTSTDSERPHDVGDVEPSSVPHLNEVDDERYSDVSSLADDDETEPPRGRSAERIVSGHTETSGGTDFEEARDNFDEELAPPPTFTSDSDKARKGSPVRDSKFHEVGI